MKRLSVLLILCLLLPVAALAEGFTYPAIFETDYKVSERKVDDNRYFISKEYLITTTDRKDAVRNKEELYKLSGTRKGLVNKWNQYK